MKWLVCCAVLVLGACGAHSSSQDDVLTETPRGPASAGLRMAVWVTPSATRGSAEPQVHVGIENV